MKVDPAPPQTDSTVHIYSTTAALLLIAAIGSILVTFFGCCGAYRESRCMLGTVSSSGWIVSV